MFFFLSNSLYFVGNEEAIIGKLDFVVNASLMYKSATVWIFLSVHPCNDEWMMRCGRLGLQHKEVVLRNKISVQRRECVQ